MRLEKKKKGVNLKGKTGPSEPTAIPKKKDRKATQKPRYSTPVQLVSESRTHSDLQE